MPHKPGSKAYRDQQRERLVRLGVDGCQLIEQIVADLMRCGCRPREAWRLACELTQDEVAARFNQIRGDPNMRMRGSRICEYEKWPRGGTRPSVRALRILAAIYRTSWDRLVDVDDLEEMPAHDRQAFLDISDLNYGDSLDLRVPRRIRRRLSTPHDGDAPQDNQPIEESATFRERLSIPSPRQQHQFHVRGDANLDDNDGTGKADGTASRGRKPWMAPPLDRIVERPELGDRLVAALTSSGPSEVGLTTTLQGAGGFGKTTLANWVCHHPEIDRRYPGGLLWATVGQEVHGADLAERINDLAFVLSGRRPAISDPDAAGAELGRLLDEREPVLLVVDDVWDLPQLRPFRFGGRYCTRLITTRIPEILPPGGAHIPVDAMSDKQARQLATDGVPGLPDGVTKQLVAVSGRWPVLLNLVNGVLRQRVSRGQPPDQAAEEVIRRLVVEGPAALDPARPADRSLAVASTVDASMSLLDRDQQQCYLDLAIFPEDVEIPLEVLRLLWPQRRVETLCEELLRLGLVADYRLNPPGPRLLVHDVIRAHLLSRRNIDDRAEVHRRLVDAALGLLPADDSSGTASWWLLPAEFGYLLRFLPYHLHEAGRSEEAAALVCDLRWVEAKTRGLGSVVSAEADLQAVKAPTAGTLRRALGRAAHLLSPLEPPDALGATLASRLQGVPDLDDLLDRYRATLARPRLEPAWRLPDLPDPGLLRGMVGHAGEVLGVAFSPDGRLLASAGYEGTVRLWDVTAGIELAVLTGAGCAGRALGVTFSPDGRQLASAHSEGTVGLWNIPAGTQRAVLMSHTGEARGVGVAFSPDGRLLATVGRDRTVRLWDVGAATEHLALTGHTDVVSGVAFSPDGRLLASAGYEGTVRLWDVTAGIELAVLTGAGCAGRALGVTFSPDGRQLASAHSEGTVGLWNIPAGTQRAVLTGHADAVSGVTFSPDGRLLASAGYEGTVRLWDVTTATEHAALSGHTGGMQGVAFSPDGQLLATAGHDRMVRLWDVTTATEHAALSGHTDRVSRVAFSPDGRLLASAGYDRTVRLWDVTTATAQAMLCGHTDWVNSVAFSPDGRLLASAGYEGTVRLWNVAAGIPDTVLTGHSGEVWGVAFSPDGRQLVSAHSDHTVRLWDIAAATEHAVLAGHTNWVWDVAFSPDGRLVASAGYEGTVRLWDVATAAEHAVLIGHTNWVWDVAFSPDGRLVASAGYEGTVRLWDVAAGSACALRVAAPLYGIAWHPHTRMVAAAGAGGLYMLNYIH